MLPVKYLFFYFSFPFLLSIDSVTESAPFLSQTLKGRNLYKRARGEVIATPSEGPSKWAEDRERDRERGIEKERRKERERESDHDGAEDPVDPYR